MDGHEHEGSIGSRDDLRRSRWSDLHDWACVGSLGEYVSLNGRRGRSITLRQAT